MNKRIKLAVIFKRNAPTSEACRLLLQAVESSGLFEVARCESLEDIPLNSDKLLIFGGDGTVLECVGYLAERGIDCAALAVNVGNLGFLTAFESDVDADVLIEALKSDEIFRLPLIEVCGVTHISYALNDVVVKAQGSRPISLDLTVDGEFADRYHGDGLIISTAAGSTAYSLSAGGPVLSPSVQGMVINPICAHSLHSRPLVVDIDAKIEVTLRGAYPARLDVDGRSSLALAGDGDSLKIARSVKSAAFVKAGQKGFYSKLLGKMNRWGVTQG